MSVCIVNYHMGNLRSVKKALDRIGVKSIVSEYPEDLLTADRIILPGVGHFEKGMQNLKKLGLDKALKAAVMVESRPILGICLGMQLLTLSSEEGGEGGLGFVQSRTRRFPAFSKESRLRVPHIGWNTVDFDPKDLLFSGIEKSEPFYFVHSYHVEKSQNDIRESMTTYGIPFVSAFSKGHIYGTQFHPEKSYDAGLRLLKNYCHL